MNKTSVVLGTALAIVGASWAGSTWYSSQHMESYYHDKIQKFNADTLNAASIKLTSFKQGFLQSRANWEISLMLDPCHPDHSMVLTGYDEIHHGFIPSLGWASIDSHIIWPDSVDAEIRKVFKGQEPITMHSRVNLLGSITTHIKSPAAQWQDKTVQVIWQGMQGNLKVSSSHKIRFDFKIPKLLVGGLDANSGSITLNGLNYKGEQKTGDFVLPLGSTEFSLDSVQASLAQQQWSLRDVVLTNKNQVNKGQLSVDVRYTVDKIRMNQQDIGDFKAKLMLGPLPAQAAQQSYVAFSRLQRQCNPSGQAMLKALEPVLKEGFQVNLSEANLNLFKGKAQANALMVMQPIAAAAQQSPQQIVSKIMINGKLQVADQLLNGVFEQVNRLKGQPVSPAEAAQAVEMLMQGMLEQGYFTKTTTGYQTTFGLSDGQSSINGKPLAARNAAYNAEQIPTTALSETQNMRAAE